MEADPFDLEDRADFERDLCDFKSTLLDFESRDLISNSPELRTLFEKLFFMELECLSIDILVASVCEVAHPCVV